MPVGESVPAPIGWVEFCVTRPLECHVVPTIPLHVVLTPAGWGDLARVNRHVNARIRPMSDLEHYGAHEKWAYPDDGYGDCEDYVLLSAAC
jgi:predicted transglutaminase-like cysteine proteinase